jgi:hypothetical protein
MSRPQWIMAGGAVIALALTAGLGWSSWTQSPTYALRAVARSVEHHDRYEFEKYVDIDGVIQSLMADLSDANGLAAAIGGAMAPQLKTTVIKAVEDGTVPPDSRFGEAVQKALHGELPKIERQGKNAYFGIAVTTNGGAPFTLKVHMTEVPDGYWRVDRVANMKDLKAIEAAEEKARKAAIMKANEDKLAQLRVVAKLHTSVAAGWSKKNRFQVRFTNGSDKTITSFSGHIRVPSADFDHGIRGSMEVLAGATENAVWELDVNQFMADTVRVYEMGETESFEVDIDTLAYADGTKVQRGSEP